MTRDFKTRFPGGNCYGIINVSASEGSTALMKFQIKFNLCTLGWPELLVKKIMASEL